MDTDLDEFAVAVVSVAGGLLLFSIILSYALVGLANIGYPLPLLTPTASPNTFELNFAYLAIDFLSWLGIAFGLKYLVDKVTR